jgi:hypothetical protein
MKTLNKLIDEYTSHLKQGDIQIAYKGILEFLGKLRAEFIKNHPNYDVSSIYQGYMDMSYFSLSTETLRSKGLKIAIVYLHENGSFEVWLSARNRDIAVRYKSAISSKIFENSDLFHDEHNQDAIIECLLTSTPDFENQELLIDIIEQGVDKFVSSINEKLQLSVKKH